MDFSTKIINGCSVEGDLVNVETFTKIIQAVYSIIEIPIWFYITHPDFNDCYIQIPHDADTNLYNAVFCETLRKNPNFFAKCESSDAELISLCHSGKARVLKNCWAGVKELFVPVLLNGEVVGRFHIGQFLTESPTEEGFRQIQDHIKIFPYDVDEAKRNYFNFHVIDRKELDRIDFLLGVMTEEMLRMIDASIIQNKKYLRLLSGNDESAKLIGESAPMKKLKEQLKNLGEGEMNVLIRGESGVGKEQVARIIHSYSPRKNKPFIVQNSASIPESLIESELFGHKKGSFTGASEDRDGLFELADGGTLFLDEIGNMPLSMQLKILRVIEDGIIKKVGSNKSKKINVRLITATNSDLEKEIEKGIFRTDLYYRINAVEIQIPPLRERQDDVALLCTHFIHEFCALYGKSLAGFSSEALALLEVYAWPGNVRECKNEMHRIVSMIAVDSLIRLDDLSLRIRNQKEKYEFALNADNPVRSLVADEIKQAVPLIVDEVLSQIKQTISQKNLQENAFPQTLVDQLQKNEREEIEKVLLQTKGSVVKAADLLHMSRVTLSSKIKKHGIVFKPKSKMNK